jgi:hypothetical protein
MVLRTAREQAGLERRVGNDVRILRVRSTHALSEAKKKIGDLNE